jgi:hypothetical protein
MGSQFKGFVATAACIFFNSAFAFAFFWTMANRAQDVASPSALLRFFAFVTAAAGIWALLWTYMNHKNR